MKRELDDDHLLSLFDVDEDEVTEPFFINRRTLFLPSNKVREALVAAGYDIPDSAEVEPVEVYYAEETEPYDG